MPRSRRQLLRAAATSLGVFGLAGCSAREQPTTITTNTTTDDPQTTTRTPTTSESDSPLRCELATRPGPGWPLPERSVGRTNYAPSATGPQQSPSVRWSVTATKPDVGEVRVTRPVVADGTLYLGRGVVVGPERRVPDEQYVDAYDAATGERRWRVPVDETPRTPFVAGERLLVSDGERIYALDPATGARQWTHEPPGGVNSLLPVGDRTFVASERVDAPDEIFALASDGTVAWRVPFPARLAPQLSSKVAWADGRAYVVTVEGVLVAVDTAEPGVVWTRDLQDGEDTAPARLLVTPCAIFVAVNGILYAVRPSGDLAWRREAGMRELATDGERIYGFGADGYVSAAALDDGARQWRQFYGVENPRHTDGFLGEPAIDDATLYGGTLDGTLVATALDDGQTRWRIRRDWSGEAQVSLAGETLYVGWGRHLLALD